MPNLFLIWNYQTPKVLLHKRGSSFPFPDRDASQRVFLYLIILRHCSLEIFRCPEVPDVPIIPLDGNQLVNPAPPLVIDVFPLLSNNNRLISSLR